MLTAKWRRYPGARLERYLQNVAVIRMAGFIHRPSCKNRKKIPYNIYGFTINRIYKKNFNMYISFFLVRSRSLRNYFSNVKTKAVASDSRKKTSAQCRQSWRRSLQQKEVRLAYLNLTLAKGQLGSWKGVLQTILALLYRCNVSQCPSLRLSATKYYYEQRLDLNMPILAQIDVDKVQLSIFIKIVDVLDLHFQGRIFESSTLGCCYMIVL